MKISQPYSTETGTGASAVAYPGGAAGAAAALADTAGAVGLDQKLSAYHALANRWTGAGHAERAALAPPLNDSPFAKTVQSALNTFTKAAWAGADAAPPAPQAQALKAFDGLTDTDKTIVASLQVGVPGARGPATVKDYRARLQSDLDAAQPAAAAPRDTVTLSPEAQARLAGAAAPDAPAAPVVEAAPQMAAALSAYGKAAG
ncbi:hypothetical protein CFHF_16170 [Caulobacter flavus]|uniref:Uncharacterized protein n=1 Tax=Caulobacter flavus TaxID=1679497 RepID=A0A2N5CR51_9CAUL|nr:hypothetical protein [Caulobacter flavus]AYV46149.1 hypothetical protein C1707_07725 [Caulobacter flavus]PLR11197.1 hypothetical protein CFHF_16170 [Caulobacter flavus]